MYFKKKIPELYNKDLYFCPENPQTNANSPYCSQMEKGVISEFRDWELVIGWLLTDTDEVANPRLTS